MSDKSKIILGALVGFLFSGVAGFYFKDWASRSIPSIQVSSVGFRGGKLEIDDQTLRMVKKLVWGDRLQKFISFDDLIEFEITLSSYEDELTRAKNRVDEWLRNHPESDMQRQMRAAAILSSPFVSESDDAVEYTAIMGSSFFGELRRRNIKQVPAEIADIKEMDSVFPVFLTGGIKTIHFGRSSIRFPTYENFGEKEHLILETVVEAFSRGHGPTIHWFHNYFSRTSGSEITNIRTAREALQAKLAEEAILSVNAWLINNGGQPTVFQPSFLGQIKFGDKNADLILEIDALDSRPNENNLQLSGVIEDKSDWIGDSVDASPFLSRQGSTRYVNVPPQSAISVSMSAKSKIGQEADTFLKFFDVGATTIQLVGLTSNDAAIASPTVEFGRIASDKQREKLLAAGADLFSE